MTAAEQPAGALGDAVALTQDERVDIMALCDEWDVPPHVWDALDVPLYALVESIIAEHLARLAAVPAAVDERAGGEVVETCVWREPHAREVDSRNPDGCSWRSLHRFTPPTQERPGD